MLAQNNSEHGSVVEYRIEFSLDSGNFFRRQCLSCGLHFKTQVAPSDFAYLLGPTFQQIESEYGIALGVHNSEGVQSPDHLSCPYCGYSDRPPNMLTDELITYARRWLYREVIVPRINSMFGEMKDEFRRNSGRSKGFLSINVRFEHTPTPLPMRPISGPELPDMVQVDLLCCGKAVKILDRWSDSLVCPFCDTVLTIQ